MEHPEHFIDQLAKVNGVLTGIALYPQVVRVMVSGATQGLSTIAFATIFVNSIVWIVYARHRHLTPLAVASALNSIAAAALTVLSFT